MGYLTGVRAVAAGIFHTVALKQDGTVWTWGYNSYGELGDGTTTNRNTPVQVMGPNGVGVLTGVIAIAAGNNLTVALKQDGTVWTWGGNQYGQLGDGTQIERHTPVQVVGPNGVGFLTGVQAIATGGSDSTSCTVALKQDGTVWTWGENAYGQLGDGTTNDSSRSVQVVGPNGMGYLTGVRAVATGNGYTVALKQDGTVWAWGSNSVGELGDGQNPYSTAPKLAFTASSMTAIAAGYNHTVALKQDGTVWTWGENAYGQLGDGTTNDRSTPVQALGIGGVGFLTSVTAIAAGYNHTVALKQDGTVWTWGSNSVGELMQVVGPNGMGFLTGIQAIAAGYMHTVALKQDGTVWTWGTNYSNYSNTPVQVMGPNGMGYLTSVTAIAAGGGYTVALKQDGTVWAWGYNTYGQLGDGTTNDRSTPVQALGIGGVGFLASVTAIAAGYSHTVALLAPLVSVSGTVTLEGCVKPQQSVTFIFRPTDGSSPLTRTQKLGLDSSFTFTDIPHNRYNVAVKGAIWLQQVVPVDATGGDVSGVTVSLSAGDANNDNLVDVADFGVMVNAYGSKMSDPTSGYDPKADFNCDGKVDIVDFAALVNNYGAMGDP